jgi:hypothetical protein
MSAAEAETGPHGRKVRKAETSSDPHPWQKAAERRVKTHGTTRGIARRKRRQGPSAGFPASPDAHKAQRHETPGRARVGAEALHEALQADSARPVRIARSRSERCGREFVEAVGSRCVSNLILCGNPDS